MQKKQKQQIIINSELTEKCLSENYFIFITPRVKIKRKLRGSKF